MGLKKKAIKSGVWGASGNLGAELLSFAVNVAFARILVPEIFGIYGMMIIIVQFIGKFQELGLGPSIISDQDITDRQISSLFWFNLSVSVILMFICIAVSPLIANFYNEQQISTLLPYLAIKFPIGALVMVPSNLLKKELRLKELTLSRIGSIIPTGIGAIFLAIHDYGILSLIFFELGRSLLNTILLWLMVRWKPKLSISYSEVKEHLKFGINLQIGSFFVYGIRNSDNILIGKVLGADALGFYQMGYKIMLWPIQKMSRVMTQVMFPAMSKVKHDKEKVKNAFIEVSTHISWIMFPLIGFIFIQADNIIILMLGEKWIPTIPIFKVLCLLGINQSITTNISWIFYSQGRTDLRLKLYMFLFPIIFLSFVIGLKWGALGVAISYTVVSYLNTPIIINYAGKLINMNFLSLLKGLYKNFIVSVIIIFTIESLNKSVFTFFDSRLLELSVNIILLTVFYLGFMFFKKDITLKLILIDILKLKRFNSYLLKG